MAGRSDTIADAELEVLKILWGTPQSTVREITSSIYGDMSPSHVGTVQKLLQRLEAKRCVKRDRREYIHRFSARVSRNEVAGWQLDVLAKKVAVGSLAPFITHLVRQRKLTADERDQIRRLLDE